MGLYSARLLAIAAAASFCANWQFAFQITYVNTSVRAFYQLAAHAVKESRGPDAVIPPEEWSSQWGTIVSSFYPGSVVGFLVMPSMVGRFGTKVSMGILSFAAIAGCSLQLLAALPSAGLALLDAALCGGRFLVGIQAGAALCFLPLYIQEISNPESRSLLSTFQQVSQATGTLLGLLFGSEPLCPLGAHRFEWLQLIAVLPSIMLIILLVSTPPTPHYLMRQSADITHVVESLRYYQGSVGDLKTLMDDFAANTNNNRRSSSTSSSSRKIPWSSWKGFFIGSIAAISYAFTADDLIDTFSSHMLNAAQGADPEPGSNPEMESSADIMSFALGVVLLIASMAGSFLVDRFGRRPLILIGLVGTAVFNILAAIFLESSPTLVLIFFGLTKACIGLGAGAPAWFLTSELVALSLVPLFQSLSTGLLLCSSMVVTFFFLPISLFSPPLAFLVLSAIPALILALILFLFLPETKGKHPREVQQRLSMRALSGFAPAASQIYVQTSYGSMTKAESGQF